MKNFGDIQSPFDNAICPMFGESDTGEGAKDVNGVDIKDGQKGTAGEMPEVNGISIKDDDFKGSRP